MKSRDPNKLKQRNVKTLTTTQSKTQPTKIIQSILCLQ